ncbi:hypothetical protein SOV_07970 [Sporomusa ovata DSM 2662]|uniref:Uncharacterized protein n=1 Tax=Sporomusa ovata TaxID=2378 RepID=A0A0U1L665_9FIRM|nr:hypothetical protein [Sporomusa ovata]EQB28449.1 hypothetical protein SOV_1c01350 [Sporomusa ovata DSM 2662]CQR74769.1 hypothetical protein SpAn4DRAFT_4126 [Sporomusa ovata]
MCDIDGLFMRIGDMDRTELAKAYLMALKENADLSRQLKKSLERSQQTDVEPEPDTKGDWNG